MMPAAPVRLAQMAMARVRSVSLKTLTTIDRVEATFRAPAGATLRVSGDVDGHVTELLRFDDFIDGPHYHIPPAGDPIPFDQAALGEPLTWFIAQLRDHLAELLTQAGFARILPD